MFWMVCYDIGDDRVRLRAAKALSRYGERVQRSVYECHLSAREIQTLRRELIGIIDPTSDRVRFYPLCERDRAGVRVEGRQAPAVLQDVRYRLV